MKLKFTGNIFLTKDKYYNIYLNEDDGFNVVSDNGKIIGFNISTLPFLFKHINITRKNKIKSILNETSLEM